MALEQILAHKRDEIAGRKAAISLEALLARCTPSTRGLERALRVGRPGFLLEVKFASPSAGTIRADADLEPVILSYGRHADAVSVLTDERFFGGTMARLAAVRERLDQPLLCKDFFLDPWQVAEARLHGADAILLILAAVDDAAWRACAGLAERLGMEVLTEAHDAAEVDRAVALGARMIGINNRDLRTLQIDMNTTPTLAPSVPADRLVVAESGFAERSDVARFRGHADAFLVGSALMRERDVDRAVRHMVYGVTKICGLTDSSQAATAHAAGATHGGLMFAPASSRRITIEQAERIRSAAPLDWVGVFTDTPAAEIGAAARRLGLAAVQLHGDESPAEVAAAKRAVPDRCEVWKAVRVRDAVPRRATLGADRLLLDGWSEGVQGGTGRTFDWTLLADHPERGDALLAGGLRPENATAAAALHSWGLDVSSGVESAPGQKDPARVAAFLAARRRIPGRGDQS